MPPCAAKRNSMGRTCRTHELIVARNDNDTSPAVGGDRLRHRRPCLDDRQRRGRATVPSDRQSDALDVCFRPLFRDEGYRRDQLEPLANLTDWLRDNVRRDPHGQDTQMLLPDLAAHVTATALERHRTILEVSELTFHTDRSAPTSSSRKAGSGPTRPRSAASTPDWQSSCSDRTRTPCSTSASPRSHARSTSLLPHPPPVPPRRTNRTSIHPGFGDRRAGYPEEVSAGRDSLGGGRSPTRPLDLRRTDHAPDVVRAAAPRAVGPALRRGGTCAKRRVHEPRRLVRGTDGQALSTGDRRRVCDGFREWRRVPGERLSHTCETAIEVVMTSSRQHPIPKPPLIIEEGGQSVSVGSIDLPNRLLTAFEVASFVGCHEESVRRAYRRGLLESQRCGARNRRLHAADVLNWIARGAPTKTPEPRASATPRDRPAQTAAFNDGGPMAFRRRTKSFVAGWS